MMIGLYEFGHISFGLTFPMTMDLHAANGVWPTWTILRKNREKEMDISRQ
jgi:hypothetical protein